MLQKLFSLLSASVGLCLPLLAATVIQATVLQANDRPNILFVFADDWGRYASAYGRLEPGTINDAVLTPNFDRLAASGVLLTHAFVNSPSCTPCRSSLLSGQHFWRTGRGAILQGAVWDTQIPTFPLMLESSGYHIGHTSKVWSPGSPANAPIGAQRTAVKPAPANFNNFSEYVHAAPAPEAAKSKLLAEVASNFRTFLNASEKNRPFLYWWGPTNTHRTWVRGSGQKLWNIHPDSLKGKLPRHFPDVPAVREDVADYLGEVQALDAGLGSLLQVLEESGQKNNTMVIVSGDHGIPGMPAGKCNLYDLGTRVSLAISWPDHIPANRVIEDFVSLPDLAPTILDAAGIETPQVMTGKSLLAILKSSATGQLDPQRDHVLIGRERHVARARADLLPYPQRAIRTRDFLYIHNFAPDRWPMGIAPGFGLPPGPMPSHEQLESSTFAAFADMDASPTRTWLIENAVDNPAYRPYFNRAFAQRPAEELYDLKKDPDQWTNVASDPAYADIRTSLSLRLMDLLKSTNDPRVTSTPSAFDLPPYSADPDVAAETKNKSGRNAPK